MQLHNQDITAEEFKVVQKFLCDACGIVLNEGKEYLVKSRLMGVLRETHHATVSDLVKALRNGNLTQAAQELVVDAMTTNETFWFRDPNQFEELKRAILPELMSRGGLSPLRIWSAASSTGQEPYSISMCLEEFLRAPGAAAASPKKNTLILGTDICTRVLADAKEAVYNELSLSRGLNQEYKTRYFKKHHGGWKLDESVTSRVRFQQFNLLKPYGSLGKFDIVFCRNVLIYFAEDVKRDMIARMAQCLAPGGYFFLSSTEALPRDLDMLEPAGTSQVRYYRLKS